MLERFENASGFIFDCDGCLLDSMEAWRDVEFTLIRLSQVEFTQSMLESLRAAPIPEVGRIMHEKYGVMDSVQAVLDYIDDRMWRYYREEAKLKPGAREFVARLRSRDIPCCIVTATSQPMVEAGLRTCGVLDQFEFVLSTTEENMSKQNPQLFERALERMGAQAATAWGADDSLYAIRVMDGLGISTIGTYDNEYAGTLEQLAEAATIAVNDFQELL